MKFGDIVTWNPSGALPAPVARKYMVIGPATTDRKSKIRVISLGTGVMYQFSRMSIKPVPLGSYLTSVR